MSIWEKAERKGSMAEGEAEGEDSQRQPLEGGMGAEREVAQPLAAGGVLGLGAAASPIEQGLLQRQIQQRQSDGGGTRVPSVPLPYLDAIQRFFEGGGAASGGTGLQSETAHVHQAAVHGTSGAGGPYPYLDQIQRSFGRHDVSHVQGHVGQAATEGAKAMGAEAYTTGDRVAFAGTPSLHTAAHEAAHVIQQRAGVQLKGGVGEVGDPYERHADAVADAVVQGKSSEALLDGYAGTARPQAQSVQRMKVDTNNRRQVDALKARYLTARAGDFNGWQALLDSARNLSALEAGVDGITPVAQVEEKKEIVWEEYTGRSLLYRWTSTAGAKVAKKNGIQYSGDPMDGIPTSPNPQPGAALGSGATFTDKCLVIDPNKIPGFKARYTGTRGGPKEIKILCDVPAEAIFQVISKQHV